LLDAGQQPFQVQHVAHKSDLIQADRKEELAETIQPFLRAVLGELGELGRAVELGSDQANILTL
jgi:hypothetical protein